MGTACHHHPSGHLPPESPWCLVRKGRIEEAEESFKRLSSSTDPNAARDAVALMVETTELERSMTESANYLDCLRGDNCWRTETGCVTWSSQVLVGFAVSSYAAYFYEQVGLSAKDSYKMTSAKAISILHALSFLSSSQVESDDERFSSYELTMGPIAFIFVGETSSKRLHSHSIALGRNAYNVFSIISFTVAPYILNPTEGNWKGKSGFLEDGLCLLCSLWSFLCLPECKGRTYEELDIMFSRKLKAWEFEGYVIDHQVDIEMKLQVEHHE
jgi:MFS transporter, SP family, general alpha glucoside:H+ symporter